MRLFLLTCVACACSSASTRVAVIGAGASVHFFEEGCCSLLPFGCCFFLYGVHCVLTGVARANVQAHHLWCHYKCVRRFFAVQCPAFSSKCTNSQSLAPCIQIRTQGLSAARTLVDNWPASAGELSVFVLEARDR